MALIRRRLDLLREIKNQEHLHISIELVKSCANKADELTRVPKEWLSTKPVAEAAVIGIPTLDEIREIHRKHHFGVCRTWDLAGEKYGEGVTKAKVQQVVADCEECAKLCPSVQHRWQKGNLSNTKNWSRLSCDITQIGRTPYLTVIDYHLKVLCMETTEE